ncbi:MAG TPA: c-type cytochrome [Steroidobacteraceae bacterium]|nr:c-type cytochrome [Steroidobacteraceae bacterium]
MLHVLFASAALGFYAPAHGAGDPARGKELSYTCLGCHGIPDYKNVYPTYSVPELAGQHPEYIVAALKEYKSGERSHGTMHQQAASLSEQDMQDIGSYFGVEPLPPTAAPVGTAPPRVALCGSCHGKNGVGITGDYPTLAGQHADYLARALHEYAHGDRKNAIMPNFVNGLTEEDISQLAQYYSKQRPPLHTLKRRQTFLSSSTN